MPSLYGMHDSEAVGSGVVPDGGWGVATVDLSENPQPQPYNPRVNWLVRLNNGYGSTGTIPEPHLYDEFAVKCANYAAKSGNVHSYIIGNEPNHEQERPNGVYITPRQYATCFKKCRSAIKTVNQNIRVIPAPCAPYHANPTDWLEYWEEMLEWIAADGGCDGLAIHAYTRSSKPEDIVSEAKMGAPLEGQHSGFRTYRDALEVVPPFLQTLPAYITEFNELLNDGWHDANTGVVQAAYKEINDWNQDPKNQPIHALVLYRWPKYDKWHIEGKQGVITDFKEAVAKGYKSPETVTPVIPTTPIAIVNNAIGANIRSGPSTSYSILGAVVNGTSLPITGRSSDSSWMQVSSGFGKGWISSSIIKLENPQRFMIPVVTVTVPISQTPPTTPPVAPSLNKDWLFKSWCRVLGIDQTVARAVLAIESGGRAFENGKMIIRFENHIFHLKIKQLAPQLEGKFKQHFSYGIPIYTGHEWRPNEQSAWLPEHILGQVGEWYIFNFARSIHEAAAMQSISMGMAQIMGFNYEDVGYPNVEAMFNDYNDPNLGELNQLSGFFAYIVNKDGLLEETRRKDFKTIALLYNGEGQTERYAKLLSDKYREFGGS